MDKHTLDCLKNNLNPVISEFSKPQKDCIKILVRQIFIKGTPILRHLALDDERMVKPQARKFSRHLENIDLENHVDKLALKKAKPMIEEDTSIAYDLCDIAKEESKMMEKISKVFDGSRRKISNGFYLHGVGVGDLLLKFKPHLADEHTLNQTRKKIIFDLSEKFDKKGIWLMDRGNDHKHFFRDLSKAQIKFICRIKKNRKIVIKDNGEITKIEKLSPGKYEIYLLDRHNNKVKTDIIYTVIIHEHLEKKDEMCLLTNLSSDKYSVEKFVEKYLERWGVEKSFKRIKTKFMLERIRVLSFRRFVNLVALVRLCLLLATIIYRQLLDHSQGLFINIYHLVSSFKTFIKRKSLTDNPDSFITFLGHHFKPFVTKKNLDLPNLSLFSKYALEKLAPF